MSFATPKFYGLTLALWTLLAPALFASTSKDYLPSALLQLDEQLAHHALVVEKSTHTLYLYRNQDGLPELVKSYQIASGKKAGDKLFQGDFRTPEGVYIFNDFLTHEQLLSRHGKQGEIYGVGAFVMDYPNPIDRARGKTGGGIWLHSTNDETRIDKGLDSRGCVVAANSELIEISEYIELFRTPIIVLHHVEYLSKSAFEVERQKIRQTLEAWVNDWRQENIDGYISHYHEDFYDDSRGKRDQYRQYKHAVFNAPGVPEVNMSNLSIVQSGDYVMATFKQNYRSSTIKDLGRKTLYLKKDEYYNWKIVSENWSKHGISSEENTIAFKPALRFFKTRNPSQIIQYRSQNETNEELTSDQVSSTPTDEAALTSESL